MQQLKDLIQSLLEAFISFKRAFISNQAMPGDTDVIVSANPSSTNPVRFVAPSDGYVYVSDRGVNNQVSSLEVNHADYGPFGTRSFGDGNSIIRLIFPVKKGRSVDINFSNTALTDIVCRFRSTIGGGLNTILQAVGGGLCLLSHSFNRFSSSLVAKHIHPQVLDKSTYRQRVLLQHKTVISYSAQLRAVKTLLLTRGVSCRYRASALQFVTHVLQSLALKVRTYNLITAERLTSLFSFRQKDQVNLCLKGGAL